MLFAETERGFELQNCFGGRGKGKNKKSDMKKKWGFYKLGFWGLFR